MLRIGHFVTWKSLGALAMAGVILSGCAGKHKPSEEAQIRAFLQSSASFYLQKGTEAINAAHYQEALTQFRQAEALTPYDPVLQNNKGVAFYHLGVMDSALHSYQTAVRLRPDYARAYGNMARTWLDIGQYDYALAAAAKVVQYTPASAYGHILRAEIHEKMEARDAAAQAYREALDLEPQLIDVRNNLGVLYFRMGQLDRAIDMYQQVLARDSTFAIAYFNLGNALARKCLLEDALYHYDKALSSDPEMTPARNNHGLIHLFMGRIDAALSDFYRAVTDEKALPAVHYNLSIVQSRLDSLPQAMASIERAIAQDSSVANFYLQKGLILEDLNHPDEAAAAFHRAIALDSSLSSGYNSLGNVLAGIDPVRARQAYEKALANYDDYLMQRFARTGKAIDRGYFDLLAACRDNWQISADHAMVYNNLGKVYIRLNQYDQAVRTFFKAIALQPELWEPYENLAVIRFAQKRDAEGKKMMAQGRVNRAGAAFKMDSLAAASTMLQEAIRLHPAMGSAYALIAAISQRQGNAREAETALKTGLRKDAENHALRFAYGQLLARQNRFNEARPHLLKALTLQPNAAETCLALADVYKNIGERARYDSLYARGRYLLGNQAEETGALDQALQEYTIAAQLQPFEAQYAASQALIYLKKKMPAEAENYLTTALQHDNENVLALYGMGWLLGERKHYAEAIAYLRKATARDSTFAPAYQALAVNSYFAGDQQNARFYSQRARELGIILKQEFLQSLQAEPEKP